MKILKCTDLMPGCPFETRGETEEEVLQQTIIHAKEVHGVDMTPELEETVREAIRDE